MRRSGRSRSGRWTEPFGSGVAIPAGLAIALAAAGCVPLVTDIALEDVEWEEETGPWFEGDGEVLAGGLGEVGPIAVAAGHVYFADAAAGTVARVPVGGGAVEVLARGRGAPAWVATDGADLYWTDAAKGTVERLPASGGEAPATVAGGLGEPVAIGLNAADIFWNEWTGEGLEVKRLARAAAPGEAPALLHASESFAAGLAADATGLWFAEEPANGRLGRVRRWDAATGAVSDFATGIDGPLAVAIGPSEVCWTESGPGSVACAPAAGGPARVIARGLGALRSEQGIAVDATHAYFFGGLDDFFFVGPGDEDLGEVRRVRVDGTGEVETLARLAEAVLPGGIALDETHVYWTEADWFGDGRGSVRRARK